MQTTNVVCTVLKAKMKLVFDIHLKISELLRIFRHSDFILKHSVLPKHFHFDFGFHPYCRQNKFSLLTSTPELIRPCLSVSLCVGRRLNFFFSTEEIFHKLNTDFLNILFLLQILSNVIQVIVCMYW